MFDIITGWFIFRLFYHDPQIRKIE